MNQKCKDDEEKCTRKNGEKRGENLSARLVAEVVDWAHATEDHARVEEGLAEAHVAHDLVTDSAHKEAAAQRNQQDEKALFVLLPDAPDRFGAGGRIKRRRWMPLLKKRTHAKPIIYR